MRNKLLPLLLLCGFAQAADLSGTWPDFTVGTDPSGDVTIGTGSNRWLVCVILVEAGSDISGRTWTIGGVGYDNELSYYEASTTEDHNHHTYLWDESSIGSMTGSTIAYSDGISEGNQAWTCGTVEDADQTAIATFLDTDSQTALNNGSVDTTSTANDYVIVTGIGSAADDTFTSWDTLTEIDETDGLEGGIKAFSAGAGGDATTTITPDNGGQRTYASLVFENAAGLTFTSAPALNDCDADSCTFDATPSANATWYGAAYSTGASAPADCDAVIAGTGAEATASKAVTGADTLTLDSVMPQLDYYFCLDDTTNQTANESVLNQTRDARTGYEFVTLASVAATSCFADPSPCHDDATYFSPDVAAGDIVEAVSATDPGTFTITWETDGDFSYVDATGSRQSIDYCIQDVSSAGGEFTTPACWTNGDDTIWVNNSAPECSSEDLNPIVFTEDEAITSIDLDDKCTDADSDALTHAVTTGTLPTGITLTDGVLSGTPTTEDVDGAEVETTATDVAGATDTIQALMYVVGRVPAPLLTDGDIDAAVFDMESDFPWRVGDLGLTVTFSCHETEAANQVISQDPAATTEVTHDQEFTIVASTGPCPTNTDDNALSTVFISSAVPANAAFIGGTAYHSTGRYVADCTPPNVAYVAGLAHRNDGALCIITTGSVERDINGWGVTEEGEVVADTCIATFYANGIPRGSDGKVCMTDIN